MSKHKLVWHLLSLACDSLPVSCPDWLVFQLRDARDSYATWAKLTIVVDENVCTSTDEICTRATCPVHGGA